MVKFGQFTPKQGCGRHGFGEKVLGESCRKKEIPHFDYPNRINAFNG